ncbi:BMP family ABC transporter substrate-binding protein [Aminobacterium sp. MB27-C1]|jgi:basic membrane protein A|nr:BMP family ABC transporter substrate-binding protein [Aminobacterium sp. MB27-C1]WMI71847.1 BMP family ABC transporter substrate-binding protein [Aminobacterium sp. MB27-C1]
MSKKIWCLFLAGLLLFGVIAAPVFAADKTKVALVIANKLGDASFYDSANAGLERAKKELGIVGKVVECNFDPANYVPYLATAAKNFDLVFVVGFEFIDAIEQVAPEFPNTDFAYFDVSGETAHVTYVDFKENEGSFLAGALAAMMTTRENDPHVNKDAIIGAVGGEDIPVIHNFFVGYEQGAKYVNPNCKILTGFVGSWSDPAKGKEMALNQYHNGADVIFQVAGGTGEGVIAAAKEANFYAIGVDSPQEYLAPEVVLTSMLKRLDNAAFDLIKAKQEGTYPRGQVVSYDLKNNGVGLSWTDSALKLVPEDVRVKLEEITKDVVEGKIVVEEYK